MHGEAMSASSAPAQRFLACLSDPSRFRMVMSLSHRERCVTELAAEIGLSQSCTTRHLQALEREGIVRGVRSGKRVVFALTSHRGEIHPVLRWALAAGNGEPIAEPASAAVEPTQSRIAEHEAGWVSDQPPARAAAHASHAENPVPRELEDFLL